MIDQRLQTIAVKGPAVSALLIAANLLVFGPFTVYRGNIPEFGVPLSLLLLRFAVPACLFVLACVVVGIALPDRHRLRYVAILGCVGILLWLQANILVWDYGVLDGTTIDWTKYRWQGWVDGSIWGALLVGAALGYRWLYRPVTVAAGTLLFLQALLVAAVSVRQPQVWTTESPSTAAAPPGLFELSSDQNVLQIVLDQFGSTLFDDILERESDYFEKLDGFVFFREAISSTPVTYLSVPAFLSGETYANQMPVQDFHARYYAGDNIQTLLASRRNYALDVATQNSFVKRRDKDANYFWIPTPYGVAPGGGTLAYKAAFAFDLVLFRSVPHALKRFVYNDQSWLLSSVFAASASARYEHFAADAFLRDFARRATVGGDRPRYKYIHVNSPHPPLVSAAGCQFAGRVLPTSRESFRHQAECALRSTLGLLDRIKALGLYDSALIIVQSDHGSGVPFEMRLRDGRTVDSDSTDLDLSDSFMPLLLVKKPHHHGPLQVSAVEAELGDLPVTISSILGVEQRFPGRSLFLSRPAGSRQRRAYYSSGTDRDSAMVSGYFNDLQEYLVGGSVFRRESWRKGVLLRRKLPPYAWGEVLRFRRDGNVLPYLRGGWDLPEETVICNNGKTASIRLPIPHPEPDTSLIELTVELQPFLFPAAGVDRQRVQVGVNGTSVGEWTAVESGRQTYSVLFSNTLLADASDLLLTLTFPDAVVPSRLGVGPDQRTVSVALSAVTLACRGGYRYGRMLTFGEEGEALPYLREGWSRVGKKFFWSDGTRAAVEIPVAASESPVTLEAWVHPFLVPGKLDAQTVRVAANGLVAGEWTLTTPGWQRVSMPLPKEVSGRAGTLHITLEMPSAAVPRRLGVNADERMLGLGISALTLTN